MSEPQDEAIQSPLAQARLLREQRTSHRLTEMAALAVNEEDVEIVSLRQYPALHGTSDHQGRRPGISLRAGPCDDRDGGGRCLERCAARRVHGV